MDRRSFLQVMGLAVSAPSFIVKEKDSPPKRQNPDFISTGFPTIDDALGGGFKRGTYNTVYGHNNPARKRQQSYQTSLLMKSIAIKAASDLHQRSSVLLISPTESYHSNKATPFDGLLTTTQFLEWSSISNYDLVIIDREKSEDWKTETFLSRNLELIARLDNVVIVQRNFANKFWSYEEQQDLRSCHKLDCCVDSSMFCATTALKIYTKEEWISGDSFHVLRRYPTTLQILKNRYGPDNVVIDLKKSFTHFYEEA